MFSWARIELYLSFWTRHSGLHPQLHPLARALHRFRDRSRGHLAHLTKNIKDKSEGGGGRGPLFRFFNVDDHLWGLDVGVEFYSALGSESDSGLFIDLPFAFEILV